MPTELKLTPIKESLTPLQKIAFTAILKKVFKLCDITKRGKLTRSITGSYVQLFFHKDHNASEELSVLYDPEMQVMFIDNVISTKQGVAVKNLLIEILGRNVNYTRDHNLHVFHPVEMK